MAFQKYSSEGPSTVKVADNERERKAGFDGEGEVSEQVDARGEQSATEAEADEGGPS